FRVGEYMEGALLGLGIRPGLTDTVPDLCGLCRIRRIILRKVPALNDGAELLHVSGTGGIAAVLTKLYRLLIIRTALQSIIAQLIAVHGSKQVSAVVCNRVLNAGVFPEIRRDCLIAAVR